MTRRTGTKDISNTITERKGVCEIEKRCCSINWVFRERGHSDYGIDADMEESVIENGVPKLTNRHIALQISLSSSYRDVVPKDIIHQFLHLTDLGNLAI